MDSLEDAKKRNDVAYRNAMIVVRLNIAVIFIIVLVRIFC